MAKRSVEALEAVRRRDIGELQINQVNPEAQRWIATINNYSDDQYNSVKIFITMWCRYGIVGKEIAPTTQTPHLQCYFHLKKRMRKQSIYAKLGFNNFYLEVAKGTEDSNIRYCRKENNYFEDGKLPATVEKRLGEDDFYGQMMKDIKELSIEELDAKYPKQMILHRNQILSVRRDSMLRNVATRGTYNGDLQIKNLWIFGKAGIGKSKWVHQVSPLEIYPKAFNKWWDGYILNDHKIVCIDDFPWKGDALTQHIKIWADRYPFLGEIKGGSMVIYPGTFRLIITSNHSIDECFQNASDEDIQALKRRFKEVQILATDDLFLQSNVTFEMIQ